MNDPDSELNEQHGVSPASFQVLRVHFFEIDTHHLAEHCTWWAEDHDLDLPQFQ